MVTNELDRPIDERLKEAGFSELTEAGIKRNDRTYRRHNQSLPDTLTFKAHPNPGQQDIDLLYLNEFLEICDKAQLTARQKDCVLLDNIADQSNDNIAARVRCSEATVRRDLKVAYERIGQWLEQYPYWNLSEVLREVFGDKIVRLARKLG